MNVAPARLPAVQMTRRWIAQQSTLGPVVGQQAPPMPVHHEQPAPVGAGVDAYRPLARSEAGHLALQVHVDDGYGVAACVGHKNLARQRL